MPDVQRWQPADDLEEPLTQLGTGEAVVTTVLSETGAPSLVAWTRVRTRRAQQGTQRGSR